MILQAFSAPADHQHWPSIIWQHPDSLLYSVCRL